MDMFKKILYNILLAEDWTFGKQIVSALIIFLVISALLILYKKKGFFISLVVSLMKSIGIGG